MPKEAAVLLFSPGTRSPPDEGYGREWGKGNGIWIRDRGLRQRLSVEMAAVTRDRLAVPGFLNG